jgi:membrane fusion protein (multidrug efflux system)
MKFISNPACCFGSLIVPVLLILAGCSKETVKEAPPAKVNVIKAVQSDVPLYEEFVSQVYGSSDVNLRARVDGWITEIHFREGSMVSKGALLYTIDDLEYQNEADRQASDLARANTELVRAGNELGRVRPLAEMNALSQKDLDNAIAAYDAAQAEVKSAEAMLENARIKLGYTRVYAPFDGLVGISNFREGDYVSRVGSTSVLTTISKIESVRVRFQISEREALRVSQFSLEQREAIKSDLQLILPDQTTYPHPGKVNFANREIDPKTGTLTIEALFPNPEGLLRPGLFVKTRVLMDSYMGAILVPQRSVIQLQNLTQVYVVTDSGTLKAISVEPGPKTGDAWIISTGLEAGDRVAVVGSTTLTPDAKIEPVEMKWPGDNQDQ